MGVMELLKFRQIEVCQRIGIANQKATLTSNKFPVVADSPAASKQLRLICLIRGHPCTTLVVLSHKGSYRIWKIMGIHYYFRNTMCVQ
ncbi:hypothetical protein SDC9_153930 [bioreactor metagenome]|uniref:Uncharacterized protein n=1 Tax=bioreactor metagenome TaxID=1076179 RepID=A0A645F230_9ZZZZ